MSLTLAAAVVALSTRVRLGIARSVIMAAAQLAVVAGVLNAVLRRRK